jgi:hypothetical protein
MINELAAIKTTIAGMIASTVGITAVQLLPDDPIAAGERIEKLGIVGVLVVLLVVLLGILLWFIRLVVIKGVGQLEANTVATTRQVESNEQLKESITKTGEALDRIREHCAKQNGGS